MNFMRDWMVKKRKNLKLSQSFVASAVGISRGHYSDIENSRRDPSGKVAKKLADFFKVDMALFFKDIGRKTRNEKTKSA